MPRKTTIPLYDGDDFERLAELRREVDIAERALTLAQAAPMRQGDDVPSNESVEAAKAAFNAFVSEAAERAEEWVLHALGHVAWRELVADHPPRMVPDPENEGQERPHEDDAGFDVNMATFPTALLLFVDPEDDEHRTVHAPFTDAKALAKRVRRLAEGEFETLWGAAYALNVGAVRDPKLTTYALAQKSSVT